MKTEVMYFYHLDELRSENNIDIDFFIDGICSERQYWRYRSGENVCPQDRLSKFIERLNLTHSEFFNYFYTKELSEFKKLEELYQLIMSGEFHKSKTLLDNFHNTNFASYESKSLYELCVLLYENIGSNLPLEQRIRSYSKFIDYPNVLSKTYYSFRDIVLLIEIAKFEKENKIYTAVDRLYEILRLGITYVSGNSRFFMPSIFVSVVKIYGSLGHYQKALDISNEGITYSIKIQDSRALPNLYHLSAIAKFKLGIRDQFEDDIVRCLFCSLASHNEQVYQTYVGLVHKAFGISPSAIPNLINTYLESSTKKTDED